jgi:hypothetical protein
MLQITASLQGDAPSQRPNPHKFPDLPRPRSGLADTLAQICGPVTCGGAVQCGADIPELTRIERVDGP